MLSPYDQGWSHTYCVLLILTFKHCLHAQTSTKSVRLSSKSSVIAFHPIVWLATSRISNIGFTNPAYVILSTFTMYKSNIPFNCLKCTTLHFHSHIIRSISFIHYSIITGPFTQHTIERTGDRRLLVLKSHQGGCNHATNYKYKCSCIISQLLPI